MFMLSDDKELVEGMAMDIYCDSFTQYGTCTPHRWKQTSETQREFHRSQVRVALERMEQRLRAKGWKPPVSGI